MGRSPCCNKIGLKKGPWTSEEDQKLLQYIEEHGHGGWRALPTKAGLQRCGKSCRLRWANYLRPDIKRGKFSSQEEQTIIQLHALLGNRWSAIATHLPKRTDNEIKNYWNTHIKKRLSKMGIDPVTHKTQNDAVLSKYAANLSHMAQWEIARLQAEARLVRQSKLCFTSFNSFPQNKSEFASSSISLHKPPRPARCLDVLKAWSDNVWAKTAAGGVSLMGISGSDLESPVSTRIAAEGLAPFVELQQNSSAVGGIVKYESEEEWKILPGYNNGFANSMSFSMEGNSSEHVPCENFAEQLMMSSHSDRRLSDDGGESDNGSASGGAGGSDCYEDKKNYWDSILNVVNFDLPMF